MASKLEALLAKIRPDRTIDPIGRDVDDAVNSFPDCTAQVTEWPEFEALLGRFLGHVEAHILHIPDAAFVGDVGFSWSRCINFLNRAFGSSGPKAAFEMARTGNEGGIYAVLRKVASLIAAEYVNNMIGACVWSYWNSLSVDEKLAAGEEYVAKYGHLLPGELVEGSAARIRADLPKVLQQHPRLVRGLDRVGRR